jgi:hypothetical protein
VDPVSVEPVPVDPVPVDSVPVDPVPVDPVPVDSVPVDSVPVDPVPVDSVPVDSVPLLLFEGVVLVPVTLLDPVVPDGVDPAVLVDADGLVDDVLSPVGVDALVPVEVDAPVVIGAVDDDSAVVAVEVEGSVDVPTDVGSLVEVSVP